MEPAFPPRGFYQYDVDEGLGDPLEKHELCFEIADTRFFLTEGFAYSDSDHVMYIVEPDLETDLMSVPPAFRWLIERIGPAMPAVLLHDAHVVAVRPGPADRVATQIALLVATLALGIVGIAALVWSPLPWWLALVALAGLAVTTRVKAPLPNDPPPPGVQSYVGPPIGRIDADRLLRRTLRERGTPPIQRWLIWDAVSLATLWDAPGEQPALRLRWRALVLLSTAAVVVLGLLATIDLLDVGELVPWLGDGPWWQEVLLGGVMAVVVPLAIALALWRSLWPVFATGGVALALLLHVTLAVVAVTAIYQLSERIARVIERRLP